MFTRTRLLYYYCCRISIYIADYVISVSTQLFAVECQLLGGGSVCIVVLISNGKYLLYSRSSHFEAVLAWHKRDQSKIKMPNLLVGTS